MTGEPTPDNPPRFRPMTLALAGVAVAAAAMSLLPPSSRPWNLSAIGALGLFAAARLGFWPAVGLVSLALGLKDLGVYLHYGMEPHPQTWVCFGVYVLLGWALLRRTESPVAIGGAAVAGGFLFFLVTNFGSWLEQAYPYGYSLAGLLDCYTAAIPFYRGTATGDLVFTAGLFGAHAVLSRAYFPEERVARLADGTSTERHQESWR